MKDEVKDKFLDLLKGLAKEIPLTALVHGIKQYAERYLESPTEENENLLSGAVGTYMLHQQDKLGR